jgi:restriction system protein
MYVMDMPTYDSLMNPMLKALYMLGGSGSIDEIHEKTIEVANLPDEILDIPHGVGGARSEIEYRMAWTRTYLKKYGLLENSSRGVWALTKTGEAPIEVDPRELVKQVRETFKQEKEKTGDKSRKETPDDYDNVDFSRWEDELKNILLALEPSQFERLAQRLLRECGFIQVEVLGRSGDGGIDGKGLIKLAGLISFHAMFQCKRFKDTVTPSHIRDFRGALQGRADKGIFITTGFFTKDAKKEAHRDGAPPIDLIDGDDLVNMLKVLSLGVKIELVENVTIDKEWFANI